MSRTINLFQALQEALSPELWRLIQSAGETGAAQGQPLYLVGGRVRDLILGHDRGDMDLVAEGDALTLAQSLAKEHGGKVIAHQRFGTAKYRRGDLTIDLATARSEVYARPGALPQVKPGSIYADLARRDFTINAMALHLSPPQTGRLLDPFNGRNDLEDGLVRILHPASFIDDATRIMRAIRYEQRLRFSLEGKTEELLLRDISRLETVGVDRLRHELELILSEQQPEFALGRADELGVLKQIYPALRADDWLAQVYRKARASETPPGIGIYLALLVYRLTPEDALDFAQRYRFTREQVQIVQDLVKLESQQGSLEARGLLPSEIYAMLDSLSPDAIEAFGLACGSGRVAERAHLYLTELRHVKPHLDGHQLKALGVAQGPEMGQILKALLKERLDGKVQSKEDEVSYVQEWLRKRSHE